MATSTEEPKLPGGYLVTPRVPQGLAAAVEGLTREVIRHSPEDIYVFAAHHFEKLLVLREKCGGLEKTPDRDGNLRTLREMSQALRRREFDRENPRVSRNTLDQVGWSLNQTAKVLKRHRSIFGDEGRRITTDEVFRMASQKENRSISPKSSGKKAEKREKRSCKEKTSGELWKASTSRNECSWSNDDSGESNVERTRTGPRIMTQIPNLPGGTEILAKDIKTELRKNRISSRERRSIRTKPDERNTPDKLERKVVKSGSKNVSSKKSLDKQKRTTGEVESKHGRKSQDSTRSSKEHSRRSDSGEEATRHSQGKSRTPNMNKVRDYTVQRFATTKSLEELQTINYVEKVQEIIDKTGPIINEKIEELKSGMIGRSKRSAWFTDPRNNPAGESSNSLSEKREYSKDSPEERKSPVTSTDALRSRLTETHDLLKNVSTSLTRSSRRSRSARSSRRRESLKMEIKEEIPTCKSPREDASSSESSNRGNGLEKKLSKTQNLLEDISSTLSRPMRRSSSAKSFRKRNETIEDSDEIGSEDALKKRLDETRNLLKGISAIFPRHAGSGKESRNGRRLEPEESSYSDGHTASKSSLPAVRSISLKNSSGSVSRSDLDNLVLPAISPEVPKSAKVKEDLVLPVLSPPGTASTNEDSNRIEEIDDDVVLEELQIPLEDYVPEVGDNVSRDSLNVTPDFDSIPQRPDSLEPEEVVDDLEPKTPDVGDLEPKSSEVKAEVSMVDDLELNTLEVDDLRPKTPTMDDLEAKTSAADDLEPATSEVDDLRPKTPTMDDLEPKSPEMDDLEAKTPEVDDLEAKTQEVDDLETRLQEIEKVERDVEEAFAPKTSEEYENSVDQNKLQELEETERSIERISDAETPKGSKDSTTSDKDVDAAMENTDAPENTGRSVDEETNVERTESQPSEVDEAEENEESRVEESQVDKLTNVSPESINYTYILSEGSPYDIPDTVTTVIIPERIVDSPLSDRLSIELEDGREAKLTLISDDGTREAWIAKTNDVGTVDKQFTESNIIETKDSDEPHESIDEERKIRPELLATIVDESLVTGSSTKSQSDPFGELVKLDIMEPASTDIDFIHKIEVNQEMQMSRQDLGRINEEMSEELEGLEEREDVVKDVVNNVTIEIGEAEQLDAVDNGENVEKKRKEDDDAEEDIVKEIEIEQNIVESDLSPEAMRPCMDSASSNEAKESSAADEPLEPAKCENSLDEEESSETTTPDESSNEVKETTLTDGLSLSIDPTRPFVPELNLDSLQDITVSSFKMTEDDCDQQERGESENTNSITETLTSDENNRIIDNGEFLDEAVMEYLASSSPRSKVGEGRREERRNVGEEIVEETIVKSRVEAKEDICEKESAYVTGPRVDEDIGDEDAKLPEVEEDAPVEEKEGEGKADETNIETSSMEQLSFEKHENEIENIPKEEETIEEPEVIDEDKNVEISEPEKAEILDEEKTETSDLEKEQIPEEENVEVSEVEKEQISEEENLEISKLQKEQISEEENVEILDPDNLAILDGEKMAICRAENVEALNIEADPEEVESNQEPEAETQESLSKHKEAETDKVKKDEEDRRSSIDVDAKPPSSELQKLEESNKSGDLNDEMRTMGEESDEILEDSYVEEETPLAVSRSASQCTTRRVSSGNLAKLREDPTLGWTEGIERDDESQEDANSPRVKFSGIGNETIKEQGSDETDRSPNSDSRTKDNKEYHIYVPEVEAADDNSTTESSTVDSAVTKIQAGVRGFLARRRLQRGQQNRSSTLSSIPSIQDSVVIEPSSTIDREIEDEIHRETRVSSARASEENDVVEAARRIQRNYRGYEARKRLRREDAIQRTTFSLEKSFAENGLQHTGEFHDCVPLPIHDVSPEKRASNLAKDSTDSRSIDSRSIDKSVTDGTKELKNINETEDKNGNETPTENLPKDIDDREDRSADREKIEEETSTPIHPGDMFFDQSPNVPVIQFDMTPNIGRLVDLVVLAKEDAALQSGYLNFITSVEDTEPIVESAGSPLDAKNFGVIIEEVTSSEAEKFMQEKEDRDRTLASDNSSMMIPEINRESITSPRAPCASSENCSTSIEGQQDQEDVSNRSEVAEEGTGSSERADEVVEPVDEEKAADLEESSQALSSNSEKRDENNFGEGELVIENVVIPGNISSIEEKELLDPENSVDSRECPIAGPDEKITSGSSNRNADLSPGKMEVLDENRATMIPDEKNSLHHEQTIDGRAKEEESIGSNVDETSSMFSFSMKVEDLLDLGSEDVVRTKPVMEVTLTPGDAMRSTSLSQESQLAGERIESPITMIQIAPERSDSLQQDEISENGGDNKTNPRDSARSPKSAKS